MEELSSMLPRHTPKAISIKRRRLGIELDADYISRTGARNRLLLDNDKLCKLDQSLTLENLTNSEYQILLGCLLGDGCIKRNGSGGKNRDKWKMRNFIFYCCHLGPQMDYNEWKANALSRLLTKTRRSITKAGKDRSELWTVSHPMFTKLRDLFYPTRHKSTKTTIPAEAIEKMDTLGLLIWYLDDGYRGDRRKPPSPKIAAKGYELESLERTTRILNENLGLHLYVKQTKHRGDTLNKLVCIPAIDRNVLFPLWQKYVEELGIPQYMKYKIDMEKSNDKLLHIGRMGTGRSGCHAA